jgi:hypothetical protein
VEEASVKAELGASGTASRTALATAIAIAVSAAPAAAAPIPQDPGIGGLPLLTGKRAPARPVSAPRVPRHPFMAANGVSNIHDDGYMTDSYTWGGPRGGAMTVRSAAYPDAPVGLCGGTIAFDRRGRLVTVCIASDLRVRLRLLHPRSLEPLASYELPERVIPPDANPFQSFTGGGYFYLDNHGRAVIPTSTLHLVIVALRDGAGGPRWVKVRDYDVSSAVPTGDGIGSVLPDSRGRLWFVSRAAGVVGVVAPKTGRVRTRTLGEAIGNSFAVDPRGGVYIASDKAMYRFDAGRSGAPRVTWRARYRNIGEVKPGQVDAGTGTTPTLMGRRYVAITDNADPMNVVVYRRAAKVRRRLVCEQPVFRKGASATENSLIGTGRSLIAENNYGYTGPPSVAGAQATAPGIERVDVDRDGRGCHRVWRSSERSPSVVPKLSLANGLAYFYTRPPGTPERWYLTALSFRTGKTVWRRLVGTGSGFNNNYAAIALSRRGVAYLGVLGGTVRMADRGR